jgi:hypothetical protein
MNDIHRINRHRRGRVSATLAGTLATMALVASGLAAQAAAESGVETAVRVMATDPTTGELTVIDPKAGEVVGRFSAPAAGYAVLFPSGTGRYLLATHSEGEHVTIVDAGLSLRDHGDHVDLVAASPFVRATVETGRTPIHGWAHDGVIAVHNDGDGTITLLDESTLDSQIVPSEFSVAQPDHGAIATLGDAMLVGYYDLGRIDAYALDGTLLQEGIATCPAVHGEAHFGDAIAFGCADGVVFVTADGDGFVGQKLAYPDTAAAGDAEAPRVSTLASHDASDVLVGDFGDGLALITGAGDDLAIEILELPAAPLTFTFDDEGQRLAVLTDDGTMHAIDPAAGEVLWSTTAVTPYAEVEIGDGYAFWPAIAASDTAAYVADAPSGQVLELDLETGAISDRFEIGGQPARVTLTLARGVSH